MESEEISDIDDDDLMKRLEAKYGRISGQNSEEEEDPDASWTSNYPELTTSQFDSVFCLNLAFIGMNVNRLVCSNRNP